MPSTTDHFGDTVTNLGPLTTTYTAPAACATVTQHIFYGNASSPAMIYAQPTCGWPPYDDCYPSGSKYDHLQDMVYSAPSRNYIWYFSPGIACPSGWTTAGTLSLVGTTTTDTHDRHGVFTDDPQHYHPTEVPIAGFPLGRQWHEIIDPGETLAYCCPDGYEAGINGGCYSSLLPYNSHTYSEFCEVYYPTEAIVHISTHKGSSLSHPVHSVVDGTAGYETSTGYMPTAASLSSYYDELAIVTFVPAVPLVYQASDLPVTEMETTVQATAEATTTSGAGSVRSPGRGSSLLPMLTLLLGVFAGAGLLAPW